MVSTKSPLQTSRPSDLRLGKLPARHDLRTLSLERYVDRGALPEPPPTLDLAAAVGEWPMYGNDRLGDCTTAAAGHMIEAWTAATGSRPLEISERAVIEAFDAVKLVDPLTGEEGAVELDVLKLWRSSGIGGHRIEAFAAVSPGDRTLVQTAVYLFGGVYIGLQLPRTAQDQNLWDWTGSLDGPAAPGSWGGHAVDVVGYDTERVTVVTWGATLEMTWAFWDRYCDEAYALLSPDYLRNGASPQGLDLAALRRDLDLVTSGGARP